jgi:hypothetical protein
MRRECSMHGERRNEYKPSVGRSKGMRPLRSRRRWEDNIKMDHKEIGYRLVKIWTETGARFSAGERLPLLHHVQLILETLSLGVNQSGSDADHSPPSTA